MPATAINFPTTRKELAELCGPNTVTFSATFEEYWNFLSEAEFTADFSNNEITVMSYETDFHSGMVGELVYLLKLIFRPGNKKYRVHPSNRPVCVQLADGFKIFHPDGSVILQPAQYFNHTPGMNAETTPYLLFEVLSPSTRSYDIATKLPAYKSIPTLKYILYLESDTVQVTMYERQGPNTWLETTLNQADATLNIEGQPILLRDIYQHIQF